MHSIPHGDPCGCRPPPHPSSNANPTSTFRNQTLLVRPMSHPSPINPLHEQAQAMVLAYGPEAGTPGGAEPIAVVGTYGELELEYAALRKGCLLLDLPHRSVLEVTGGERLEFLNRMVTQELKPGKQWLDAGVSVNSFWLNRKGRIDADLRVLVRADRVLLECDAHAAARALQGLSAYIISEDAAVVDRSQSVHRLALHGPTGALLLDSVREDDGPRIETLENGRHQSITLAGSSVLVDRRDLAGVPGLDLYVPVENVRAVYEILLTKGFSHEHPHDRAASQELAAKVRLRPGGWHAFNITRIEAGSPLYYVDFGPDSLPAETGVLEDRVSFTKGCYLGQEVVARMHSRGHSKRRLVTLRSEPAAMSVNASNEHENPMHAIAQPVGGAPVFVAGADGQPSGEAVGTVTSSTIAPMLGASVLCFAAMKSDAIGDGKRFVVPAEGQMVGMTLSEIRAER
jgi:tRNA-modifying protein YgfZ